MITRSNPIKRPAKRIKPGKRQKSWQAAVRKLKKEFEVRGIVSCEFKFEGCAGDNFLGFSHQLKRRFIPNEQIADGVVLCCSQCHSRVENAENKLELHQQAIKRRESLVLEGC